MKIPVKLMYNSLLKKHDYPVNNHCCTSQTYDIDGQNSIFEDCTDIVVVGHYCHLVADYYSVTIPSSAVTHWTDDDDDTVWSSCQLITAVLIDKHITNQQLLHNNNYRQALRHFEAMWSINHTRWQHDASQRWHYNQQLDIIISHYHDDNDKYTYTDSDLVNKFKGDYRHDYQPCIRLVGVMPLQAILQQLHADSYQQAYWQTPQHVVNLTIPALLPAGAGLSYLQTVTAPAIAIHPIVTTKAEQQAVCNVNGTPTPLQLALAVSRRCCADSWQEPQEMIATLLNNHNIRHYLISL